MERARWATPRDVSWPTRGPMLCKALELLGTPPFPWQAQVADVALEYDPISRAYRYPVVGVDVDRQAGKTRWSLGRKVMQLLIKRSLVIYLSYDRGAARVKWMENVEELMRCSSCKEPCKAGLHQCKTCGEAPGFASKVRSIIQQNHAEAMYLKNGSRYTIATPQGKGGRSLSADLVVLDEAFAFEDMRALGAIQPTLATKPLGQFVIVSSSGTAASVLLMHFRDLGRASVDGDLEPGELEQVGGGLAWFEWSPADPMCAVTDRQAWFEACPSLGLPGGPTEAAFAAAASTLPEAIFRREWLNIWSEQIYQSLIDPNQWALCRSDEPILGMPTLSLSLSLERDRAALVAAGRSRSGAIALEVLEAGDDVRWVIQRTQDVALRQLAQVVIDQGAPAASYIPMLERAGCNVRAVTAREVAQAAGDLHDAIVAVRPGALPTVVHNGDPKLTEALAGASKRRIGQSWGWGRSSSAVDVTPLEAASLARWGGRAGVDPERRLNNVRFVVDRVCGMWFNGDMTKNAVTLPPTCPVCGCHLMYGYCPSGPCMIRAAWRHHIAR